MTETSHPDPLESLRSHLAEGSVENLTSFLESTPRAEIVHTVSRLDDDERARLLALLPPEGAAAVLEALPEGQAESTIEMLAPPEAAAILEELPGDSRADLLDPDNPASEAILDAMSPEAAGETRTLQAYDDDVAGGLMGLEFMAYPETATCRDVTEDLRDQADRFRGFSVQYIFVTDARKRLTGVLRMRDLLLSRPDALLRDVMIPDPVSVGDHDSLDDLRALFEHHGLFGVPVTDEGGRLVGIVRRADVAEAMTARSEDAYLKSQGIVGREELRTMPFLGRSWRRLNWLSLNILLNVAAASVIALYQDTLATVIALVVFLPIISDMSGCSGNQAVAVSMRELTLGVLRPDEMFRVLYKELSVGLFNGTVLGLIIAGVAWLWKGNVWLGLVAGLALLLNTVVAVCMGGILPLMLRRLGKDPALASGPILTTVTDVCGFFLLLSIASALLPRLLGM